MAKMGCRWKSRPKGQHKDGHDNEDVVTYQQNVFLPFIASIWPQMCQWTKDGTLETIYKESEGPNDPGPGLPHQSLHPGWWIVIWVHDESTFYTNDQHVLHWVHSSESVKPYVKGEGASQMVVDFISLDYGWLWEKNRWVPMKKLQGTHKHL